MRKRPPGKAFDRGVAAGDVPKQRFNLLDLDHVVRSHDPPTYLSAFTRSTGVNVTDLERSPAADGTTTATTPYTTGPRFLRLRATLAAP